MGSHEWGFNISHRPPLSGVKHDKGRTCCELVKRSCQSNLRERQWPQSLELRYLL